VRARLLRLRYLCGRRGAFLFLLAAYDLFNGIYLAAGGALQHAPPAGTEFGWGVVFIVSAGVLLTGVLAQRDTWWFAYATLLKCAWAVEYLLLARSVPWDWLRGLEWLTLACVVVLVSSWPEVRSARNVRERH